jgi:GT2 family glycosyltransferase
VPLEVIRKLLVARKPKSVLEIKDADPDWSPLRHCVAHDAEWTMADDLAAWKPQSKYDVGLVGRVLEQFTVSDALFLMHRLSECCNTVILRVKRNSELVAALPTPQGVYAEDDIGVYVYTSATEKAASLPTVFVNIASYRDDQELWATVADAVAKAEHPERLRFAVVDQTAYPAREDKVSLAAPAQIEYLFVDYKFSRGPCWARAVGFTLLYNEDYVLQVDSHSRFDPGWDTWFIRTIERLKSKSSKPYLSMMPYGFTYENNKVKLDRWGSATVGQKPTQDGPMSAVAIGYTGVVDGHTEDVAGSRISAGCVFAPADLFRQVLIDPALYFYGEEHNFSARAFTHGWDLFFVAGQPVFHLFNDTKCSVRAPHWNEGDDKQRAKRWWTYDEQSNKRLKSLLVGGANLGAYGLGTARTLADYADKFGIDYPNMRVRDGFGQKKQPENSENEQHGPDNS